MLLVQKIFAINSAVESEAINHDNCPSPLLGGYPGIPLFPCWWFRREWLQDSCSPDCPAYLYQRLGM